MMLPFTPLLLSCLPHVCMLSTPLTSPLPTIAVNRWRDDGYGPHDLQKTPQVTECKAKKKKILCCPLPTERKMRKNRVFFFFFFLCQIWAKNLLKICIQWLKKNTCICVFDCIPPEFSPFRNFKKNIGKLNSLTVR